MSDETQSVRLPKRWPLVNRLQSRVPLALTSALVSPTPIPQMKDARMINCIAEYDAEDKDFIIYKRPGVGTAHFTLGVPAVGLGMFNYQGITYSVFSTTALGPQFYVESTAIGPLTGATPYWFEVIDNGPGSTIYIMIGTTASAYYYNTTSGTLLQIIGVDAPSFPTQMAVGWAYLDGTLYVMDIYGSIWGSDINSPFNWQSLNVIQADSEADMGVALRKQLSYVVAFKNWTTEVFLDNENPTGSPLAPVPQALIPLGCLDGQTVQEIDGTLFWVTANKSIAPQVARMDNLSPKIVSTPAVERILANFNNLTEGVIPRKVFPNWAWVLKYGGHRYYGLLLPGLNITLVYDIDQDLWYYWTDSNGNFWPYVATGYMSPSLGLGGRPTVQHYSNGGIYHMSAAVQYPSDLGIINVVDIYTPNFSAGTSRSKTLNMMYFDTDQVAGSYLQCRYNDNDFDPNKWTNFRTLDLSKKKPRLDKEGSFYRRAYHFRHNCATDFRIKAGDLQLDLGTL